jgi:hypothetical protein
VMAFVWFGVFVVIFRLVKVDHGTFIYFPHTRYVFTVHSGCYYVIAPQARVTIHAVLSSVLVVHATYVPAITTIERHYVQLMKQYRQCVGYYTEGVSKDLNLSSVVSQNDNVPVFFFLNNFLSVHTTIQYSTVVATTLHALL